MLFYMFGEMIKIPIIDLIRFYYNKYIYCIKFQIQKCPLAYMATQTNITLD